MWERTQRSRDCLGNGQGSTDEWEGGEEGPGGKMGVTYERWLLPLGTKYSLRERGNTQWHEKVPQEKVRDWGSDVEVKTKQKSTGGMTGWNNKKLNSSKSGKGGLAATFAADNGGRVVGKSEKACFKMKATGGKMLRTQGTKPRGGKVNRKAIRGT